MSVTNLYSKRNPKEPEQQEPKQKEPGLPMTIPLSIVRWIMYSGLFFLLLLPVPLTWAQAICMALILGHFAGQLNALKSKP